MAAEDSKYYLHQLLQLIQQTHPEWLFSLSGTELVRYMRRAEELFSYELSHMERQLESGGSASSELESQQEHLRLRFSELLAEISTDPTFLSEMHQSASETR